MPDLVGTLRRPRAGPAVLLALHVAALALFVHGFLLTRVHLPERAAPAPAGGTAANRTAPPYDRVVWLMIDALRYDFVVADGRYSCSRDQAVCHQGRMPYLSQLAKHEAARSFMFVADAPTTTTQRLKALATGGLPSFFDISNSFTAGALSDDNLIDQLAAAGHRLAFLGDTTWQQLFPTQWAWSRPYPCFNVRDLHTVDDGVWEHLLPALRQPGAWGGLLVAHYLGVDHCGHSHGVGSTEMAQKLGQMDDHVRQVVAGLLAQAGPGGAYERTLLLVSGDHGQTLGGDHGGGSPEEVDSALVAVDLKALHASQSKGRGGTGSAGQHEVASPGTGAGLGALAACRAKCTCGVERNQCAPDLLQMDLTPTLAAMLGVPTPFGNLGKLSAELWQLTASRLGSGTDSSDGGGSGGEDASSSDGTAGWESSLAEALLANAQQVHKYLHTYATTAGASFSHAALASLDGLFAVLSEPSADAMTRVSRCYAYLVAAADVARQQWTQFGDLPMALGLAVFAASLVLHAAAVFGSNTNTASTAKSKSGKTGVKAVIGGRLAALEQRLRAWQLVASWRPGHWLRLPTFRALLAAMAVVHGVGIFSFFYLLSEGKMVCYLVAAACATLALSTGRASRAAGKGIRGVAALGIMSLRCNAMMAVLGLAHHTGQGFWARLTLHDPQPADDVARGWHSKLDRMKALGLMLMARTGLDQLPPAVLAVAQHSLLCTLPIVGLALLTERLLRYSGGAGGSLRQLLHLAAFASVACFLQLEEAGKQGFLAQGISLQQLVSDHVWPLVPPGLAGTAQRAATAAAQALLVAWPAAGQYASPLAAAPLHELLPHTTYALCTAAVLHWLAAAASRPLQGAAATIAAAQLVLALLLQVSDCNAPLILLLGLLELVAVARLLAKRAELLPAAAGGASVAGEAGALVALVSAQLFYATGHLCEFAGLRYTAGFVGSQEFHLWRSSALVAVHTFGGMLLALLALPAVVQHVSQAAGAAAAGSEDGSGSGMPNGTTHARRKRAAAASSTTSSKAAESATALRQSLLVAGLVRAAAAFCASLSAAVQRRHLYAWALFAPRFAFEACFLLLADMAVLLAAALA